MKTGLDVILMYEKNKAIELADMRIAAASMCCIALFVLIPQLNNVAVNAAALATIIFCCGKNSKSSLQMALTRMKAIFVGFLVGSLVVLINQWIPAKGLFVFLAALGLLGVLAIGWAVKLPYIQTKIGCVIYVLVILVMQGSFRITYGIMFVAGSLIGACMAVTVAWLFDICRKGRKDNKI